MEFTVGVGGQAVHVLGILMPHTGVGGEEESIVGADERRCCGRFEVELRPAVP